MNIAIIPARGGSKRIPKKNIKHFLGKPIIAYSIQAAIRSNLFDRVVISTDSDEISKIAHTFGGETPFIRPDNLSDDYSGTHEVIGHAVKSLEDDGCKLDYVCCIYPTAPLIQIEDIKKGFQLVKNGQYRSVMAATSYSYPVHRSFEVLSSGGLKMIFPEHYKTRSQDLPEIYHDAGQFYWAKPEVWKDKPSSYNETNGVVKLPNFRVQDIDTIEDWQRAENIYKSLFNK